MGEIVYAKEYGYTDHTRTERVTPDTMFQAASISKAVSALGALHLVEEGMLSLDDNVNGYLKTWKLPENEFTRIEKVTLRRLLSHRGGITVHGFPGYKVDSTLPGLVQVLEGSGPANSPAIRVDPTPGSIWRYSAGGGCAILQQMMIDAADESFPSLMKKYVLLPFEMESSTYKQPLPRHLIDRAAAGHHLSGDQVEGRWHIYPELAAAGLWTTPPDLAQFAISIQKTLSGDPNQIISPSLMREALTVQHSRTGLGFFIQGSGNNLRFSHDGSNEGFESFLVSTVDGGYGSVVMINANINEQICKGIRNAIDRELRRRSN